MNSADAKFIFKTFIFRFLASVVIVHAEHGGYASYEIKRALCDNERWIRSERHIDALWSNEQLCARD
jgi:hypothetical protein